MPSPTPTRRRRALLALILLGLFCLILPKAAQDIVRGAALTALAPLLRPLGSAGVSVRRWLGHVLDVGTDRRLTDELDAMQADLTSREEELINLRRQLRGVADLREGIRTPCRAVAARVIGCDAVRWRRSLVLDKGAGDGLRAGLVVTCGKRLVGRVVSVGRDACRVQCLNDADSRVWVLIGEGDAARADGGRVQAVVQGTSGGTLRVLLCGRLALVRTGDTVVSAGYDERYPPGLWVGRVSRVGEEGSESAEVEITPACDLDAVDEVQILVPAGGE